MKLKPQPFEMIYSGVKTVEMRLNDQKRRLLCVGDEIVFTNTDTGEQMLCEILRLTAYKSFEEMYLCEDLLKCGYTDEELPSASPDDMSIYYSLEDEAEHGTLAIEVKKI